MQSEAKIVYADCKSGLNMVSQKLENHFLVFFSNSSIDNLDLSKDEALNTPVYGEYVSAKKNDNCYFNQE